MSIDLIRSLVKEVLLEQVNKKFHMDLPADLVVLSDVFKAAGHQLYVVGGSVRDALMGKEPKDYDVATDAVPDVVIDLLNKQPGYRVLEIGKAFGVVKVITPEKNDYEIATFREDVGKGRRPDSVEFTTIENDVMRRDLTINALFYDIDKGEIVDFVGGIEDIENGVVRAVGDPVERFDEDRLRILRALRFAGRMGSELDPATSEAIKKDNSLAGVSPERIRDEFLKGIKSAKDSGTFLDLVDEYDLWPQIFPGLQVDEAQMGTKNIPVVLALLLTSNDSQLVAKKLNELKYSAAEVSQVRFLLELKKLSADTAYKLKKLFVTSKLTDEDLIVYVSELKGTRLTPKLVTAFIEYSPSVTGPELMAQGFKGAELGKEIERRETEKFKEML